VTRPATAVEIYLDYELIPDRLFGMSKLRPGNKRHFVENIVFDRKQGIHTAWVTDTTYSYKFEDINQASAYLGLLFYGDSKIGLLMDITTHYNGPKQSQVYEAIRKCSQFNIVVSRAHTYVLIKRTQEQLVTNSLIKAKLASP